MSKTNEGLYDSMSMPADRPERVSEAPLEDEMLLDEGVRGSASAARGDELGERIDIDEEPTRSIDAEDTVAARAVLEDAVVEDTVEIDSPAAMGPAEDRGAETTVLLGTTPEHAALDKDEATETEDAAAEEDAEADDEVDEETETATRTAYERAAREAQVRSQQAEAAARARQRAERDRRLGTVAAAEPPAPAAATPVKRTTDRFAGSLGLFFLRLVGAIVVGVLGFQIITETEPVIKALQGIGVPQADMVAMGVGVGALAIAVMILFGLGTRIAAAILVALAGATLAFFRWGHFNPFTAGQAGFSGDMEFLLAGLGLCLLFVGAGGWSIDGSLRRSRARKKARAQR